MGHESFRVADPRKIVAKLTAAVDDAVEAVQWLTAALDTALERRSAVAALRGSQTYQDAAVIAFALAQTRHRLRRELDLPHDEHDLLADRLRDAADGIIAAGEDTDSVLVWPCQQFTARVSLDSRSGS